MQTKSPPILEVVLYRLDQEKGNLRSIAATTGIPYSTLTKISARCVLDPRVSTVQTLFDYFSARPEQSTQADRVRTTC